MKTHKNKSQRQKEDPTLILSTCWSHRPGRGSTCLAAESTCFSLVFVSQEHETVEGLKETPEDTRLALERDEFLPNRQQTPRRVRQKKTRLPSNAGRNVHVWGKQNPQNIYFALCCRFVLRLKRVSHCEYIQE